MAGGFDQRQIGSDAQRDAERASSLGPGKLTLVQRLQVQMESGAGSQATPADVQAAAAQGLGGTGGPLPHADTIQRMFGRHDVSGVQAHVGGPAADASRAIGAEAYATGNHVAFASAPTLHTAAHEAAHVVQQRGGVQLKGGVGQSGDAYEQHADQVAEAVVRGESAEGLLDQHAGGGASTAVQRKTSIVDDATDPKNKTAPGTGTGLLKDSAGKTLPDSDVKFGPLVNGCGSSVEAWRYPGDDGAGSTPSVRPPWWDTMMKDPATDASWVSNNLVQGHLLNEHLGGPGSDMRNLTPFAKSTNSQHHAKVEKLAKAIFAAKKIARYTVTVNYGTPPPAAWFGNKVPAKYLANFAYSITCVLGAHDPTTGDSISGMEDVTTITNAITGQG